MKPILLLAAIACLATPCIALAGEGETSDILVISTVRPQYPVKAISDCIDATVMLEFVVSTEGRATEIRVVESPAGGLFDQAAIDSLRQWRFKPRTENGVPVPRRATLPMSFEKAPCCE